ncbi:MAG: DMT family transporter [Nitratireductor sp.]|nr:DMT family transporter [Nitratireductor sp.]MCB1454865.1 DMT family transporter [Nitratireductor sp.]MCB1459334.1 DMT family transporter [Nitratireductor sp.]
MQPATQTNQARGVALGFTGGLVISFDVPMIRLADSDPWVAMGLRGFCIALVFGLLYAFAPRSQATPKNPFMDRDWLIVGVFYGISNIFFTFSVFNTSTANLVFILAFNSMLAAVLAWWLVGEKPFAATWAAILATLVGVLIIVSGGLASGTGWGDLTSVLCAATLAYALVHARKSGKDMSLAPGLGGVVAAVFALPFIAHDPQLPGNIGWLWANGLIVVPIAGFCLALAPSFIPAPQVAIFYLLETVLAPIWVWLVFNEEITTRTFIGGAIVLAAILAHSIWGLRRAGRVAIAAA